MNNIVADIIPEYLNYRGITTSTEQILFCFTSEFNGNVFQDN